MADRMRLGGAVVWHSLRQVLNELCAATSRSQLDVLDVGGGTGGLAVPIAVLGHRVTVVDSSPDSLAGLERRSAEAGVTEFVRGVQGDAARLADAIGPMVFDVVICHSVIEVVDDADAVVRAMVGCLHPGGVVSLVAANRIAAVLHRAVAGRFDEALHALRDPLGRYGANDPVPRRFSLHDLEQLASTAGLVVVQTHGARVFADVVPGSLFDADPQSVDALMVVELEAARVPALREIATQLHVIARRP